MAGKVFDLEDTGIMSREKFKEKQKKQSCHQMCLFLCGHGVSVGLSCMVYA